MVTNTIGIKVPTILFTFIDELCIIVSVIQSSMFTDSMFTKVKSSYNYLGNHHSTEHELKNIRVLEYYFIYPQHSKLYE